MENTRKPYATDLTDRQWEIILPLLSHLRVYIWSKRELINAVLYLVKTGCQWRNLPHDFPPWKTVYSFFRRAVKTGLWDAILLRLVEITRKNAGRTASPSYAIIDSQSVKTTAASDERGIDGGKKNQRSKATHSSRYNG